MTFNEPREDERDSREGARPGSRRRVRRWLLVAVALLVIVAFRYASSASPAPLEVSTLQEALLLDIDRWDSATSDERRQAAMDVAAATDAIEFLRLQGFEFRGREREVAVFRHLDTDMEFVLVPAGAFEKTAPRVSDGYHPTVTVVVEQPFLLARTELAWSHWERVRSSAKDELDRPVFDLNSSEAVEFCNDAGLDLPTSKQWEHAARAGLPPALGDKELLFRRGEVLTTEQYRIGDGPPDAMGLLGMHHGPSEWCVNDLSWSGDPGEPLAYELPSDERGSRVPFVLRNGGLEGCNWVDFGEPPGLIKRTLATGPGYTGLRPSRSIRVTGR